SDHYHRFQSSSPLRCPTPRATLFPYTTLFRSPRRRQIKLSARGYKVQGQNTVDLSWTGATSSSIDVYRNGLLIEVAPVHERSTRSEEHTSELQSRENLVCRLLLEKKNNNQCVS